MRPSSNKHQKPGTSEPALLSAETVADYLLDRGLLTKREKVRVRELGGGVSNVVLEVRSEKRAFVVKQAMPRLAVEDEWLAKRERVLTEAHALDLAGRLTNGAVPQVFDVDDQSFVVTLEAAPEQARNLKTMLLEGEVDSQAAQRCGEVLGVWHAASAADAHIRDRFDDWEAFDQLRVDPYYRTVAQRSPAIADRVNELASAMKGKRKALVHGDFSPKNVLVGPFGPHVWIIDFEVAHFGDPAFDIAFMTNHLMLKAIHRPGDAQRYLSFWTVLIQAYARRAPLALLTSEEYVVSHVGCLMIARVIGKSPAEYLTEEDRRRAMSVGRRLLKGESYDRAWARIAG